MRAGQESESAPNVRRMPPQALPQSTSLTPRGSVLASDRATGAR